MTDVRGKKVLVQGLGHFGGGVGVARWLCAQGAVVTVTDKEPAEKKSFIGDIKFGLKYLWNDPDLKINWNIENPSLSEKDKHLSKWKDFISLF